MFDDCPVEVFQSEKELYWLLEKFKQLKPTRILEIGSLFGGTLWHWMRNARCGFLISIDKLVSVDDARFTTQAEAHRKWFSWAEHFGPDFWLLDADSMAQSTLAQVKVFMPEIDFLFIDGDHREEVVRQDFENYSPLVRQGGMIAFHDIAFERGSEYYGVQPLWNKIKANGFRTEEIIEKPGQWGIGILYKESM